jgi:hypothetical protein
MNRAVLLVPHKSLGIIGKVSFEHLDADLVDAGSPATKLDGVSPGLIPAATLLGWPLVS